MTMDSEKVRSHRRTPRRGAIVVLSAFLIIVLLAVVAFTVDIGYLLVAKTELQRSADAAALAGVLEFYGDADSATAISTARTVARDYVGDNEILNSAATLELNSGNANIDGDIVVGHIDFDQPRNAMTFNNIDAYNAVRVRVRRSNEMNGQVPLFFARILGYRSFGLSAEATAAMIRRVEGFRIPASGENVPFLPITILVSHWEDQVGSTSDQWSYDPTDKSVSEASDGIAEVHLFPTDTGSSGNFGTLNVGTDANSTAHLSDQIANGLSQADLDYHGGELSLNSDGYLNLTGDPGISAGIKDELASIAGKPVMIPLYEQVAGTGNNAEFRIVQFVGVRIMALDLTGGDKFVAVQPADVTYSGVIQSSSDDSSQRIYSPPSLVQ